ncbi:phytanoyl-CoA dioxygenase family protein [Pseudoalteromonas luteoviolacea]|uniref:Phytanoyl-CoA dioxygenase n=1 Tax=Pseudoalteromonas luteoviolacea NCIMB 1942 TaxID=1365253 RepID=A0A166XN67_9GAMM|nr:phytanoyl-CoA dioxygenase family protein [Pseudoalteromonas luteoviolacea]KZN40620.1 hypothetical protein N482_21055 [Pseudoalteromonas luteoviolacea NCIMB 1942]KZW98313.1 hypothetical protein JL49_24195 [Pseudoalteromonas luteoviolacea]
MKNIENFKNKGFVCSSLDAIPSDLIESARTAVEEVRLGKYRTGVPPWTSIDQNLPSRLQRITQIHIANHTITELVKSSEVGKLAAEVSGSDTIKVWGSQLFYKPAGSSLGGNVGIHRDSQHVPYFTKGMLIAWIPLHSVDSHNGTINYVNGSHKWQRNLAFTGGDFQNLDQQRSRIQMFCSDTWDETSIKLEAGQFAIHDMHTLHFSSTNESNQDRAALSFGLLTDEAEFNHEAPHYGYGDILNNPALCPTIFDGK